MRSKLRLRVTIATTAAVAVTAAGVAAVSWAGTDDADQPRSEPRATEPVINENFADPGVLRDGDTYYAYSTSSSHGRAPVAKAEAPGGPWEIVGDALPDKPEWAGDTDFWAADVAERPGGDYLMYFTAPHPDAMCVGAAVGDSPEGPFEPVGDGPLVCDPAEGGAIDPAPFVDADGSTYLLYKNDGNAIGQPSCLYAQPTEDDGVTLTGEREQLLCSDREDERGVIEAPTLVQRDSGYVLLYSAAEFGNESYRTGWASSASLDEPFVKSETPLMTTESTGIVGPGGADVDGDDIFFHGWLNGEFVDRGMFVGSLAWDGDTPSVQL